MHFWCVFKALKYAITSTDSRKMMEFTSLTENLVASLKTVFELKLKRKLQTYSRPFYLSREDSADRRKPEWWKE